MAGEGLDRVVWFRPPTKCRSEGSCLFACLSTHTLALNLTSPFQATFLSAEVTPGLNIRPADAQSPPEIQFPTKPGEYYCLAMIDPDAPYPHSPELREWRHWLIANIPSEGDLSKGLTLSGYMGPSPPLDSPPHRYYLVLFKQSRAKLGEETPMNDTHRARFSLVGFAGKHDLGKPIGWTWFMSSSQPSFGEAIEKRSSKTAAR